jgi:hypothetical protein
MSTIIEALREQLKLSNEATAQDIAHHKDRRRSKPPYDEWWGPAAIQDAAGTALEHLPKLLALYDALRQQIEACPFGMTTELHMALNELNKPVKP